MRIVGGQFRGRALVAPEGQGTRPTSDRAREALFNVLAHASWAPDLNGARVIDLFAGSGALGFEAISRGASFCLFVETDDDARGSIRENAENLGLFGKTRVHRRSATDLGVRPGSAGEAFTVAFLDPPYGKGLGEQTLIKLIEGDWLAPQAVVVFERAADDLDLQHPGYERLDERTWGAARVWFLRRQA
ncbi:16S rRNA (guanine(966)-N(2))-methyltransferase RsmD [Brevundimonas aveniformis]|uniref:16S rRNA (guanine(966)-N(2))-methyltransferase RsmD n=1 Tax=Brevundimonas aveniformis TaxID=370977 RepID=UPI002492540E|nr:16S rRNA (guanine(966)-N(2))-methyltransferase RsmD [Brevundimonas aveniformis]